MKDLAGLSAIDRAANAKIKALLMAPKKASAKKRATKKTRAVKKRPAKGE